MYHDSRLLQSNDMKYLDSFLFLILLFFLLSNTKISKNFPQDIFCVAFSYDITKGLQCGAELYG